MHGAWIFALEPRLLLSDPSAREQYMLQLINRARIDPVDELPLILNSNDPDIPNALKSFSVDKTMLQQQWATLTAVPPLAWNDDLGTSATGHTQLMLQDDTQSHQLPGEPDLGTRVNNAGYSPYSFLGENVYTSANSVLFGDAAFLIDWGDGPGGMQSPPGHRDNIYSANFSEVGISILDSTAGKTSGPLLMTEDFGSRFEEGNPYLLGVAFNDDVTADNFYTPGEGLAGVTITATSTTNSQQFTATANSAGGYEMQLPADTYDVTANGPGLTSPITHNNVVVAASNVETDFEVPATTPPGGGGGGGGGSGGGGAPSLQASFAGKIPASLKPAQKAKISLKISNTGADASAAGSDSLYLSTDQAFDDGDLQVATASFPAIAAGKSKNIAFSFTSPLTLADGNYYLIATNNGAAVAASSSAVHIIAPTTNLIPSLAGALKIKNSTLPVLVKIKNSGNYTASGTGVLSFALRPTTGGADISVGSANLPNIKIKANGTLSFHRAVNLPADLVAESYRLVATLDSDLSMAETTTADNTAVSTGSLVIS